MVDKLIYVYTDNGTVLLCKVIEENPIIGSKRYSEFERIEALQAIYKMVDNIVEGEIVHPLPVAEDGKDYNAILERGNSFIFKNKSQERGAN